MKQEYRQQGQKYLELARKLRGINTLKMIELALNVDRAKAIYLVHKLRQKGFVKTKYKQDKIRVYYIYPDKTLNKANYIDIINKYSPTKLVAVNPYIIHNRIPSIEETLIYAIKKRQVRFIIASLGLFKKIRDWSLLYKLAKKEDVVREVAALYDIARLVVKKVKRIPKRFKNLTTPKKNDKYKYIIENFESDHFKKIEDKWKVYIPLNWGDLEEYKYD